MQWASVFIGMIMVGFGFAILPPLSNLVPDVPNPLNVLFHNKCIEDLGCFYTGSPFFHAINRPISLPPSECKKTKFLLFTESNPQGEEELQPNLESLANSTFNPDLPTKVLIHGFRSDLEVEDIRFEIKDALLNVTQCNVLVVDWTEHNGLPYSQAVANARVVGARLAKLLQFLIDNAGIRPQSIHIIGHSLGGHVSGWAGERIPHIGRITGLDPAGPQFQNAENEVRLDYTDADFVDIIHSDGGENVIDGLGLGDPIGHMDFYPNGGRRQPGCFYASKRDNVVGSVVNVTTKWLSNGCDHERANNYFLESILNRGCFKAVHCSSYLDYEKGDCPPANSTVAEMGYYARWIPEMAVMSKFFLRTNGSSPFCDEDSIYL